MAVPKFLEHNRIKLNDHHAIRFQKCCIATRDKYRIPEEIKSLNRSEYLLPEDLFNLKKLPTDILILGSDKIGLELAQGHRRLGTHVTIIDSRNDIVGLIDHDCVQYLEKQLLQDGIKILKNIRISKITKNEKMNKIEVHFEKVKGIAKIIYFS